MVMALDAASSAEAKMLWVSSEPEPRIRELLDGVEAIAVETASSGRECCNALSAYSYSAVVANFPLQDCTPDELLTEVKRVDPFVPVLIRDAAATISGAVRLTKAGADNIFGADFDPEESTREIEVARELRSPRDLAALSSALERAAPPWRKLLVGDSRAMDRVFRIIDLVGPRRCTVLISGETGTGKEMVAKAVHAASRRSRLPIVTVNCAALPENLLEAELFGH